MPLARLRGRTNRSPKEILRAEGVYPTALTGHGGLFKTPGVAEKILSEMLGIPVTTRATAGEGGAWGIAKLATSLFAEGVI